MIELTINGKRVSAPEGSTILEAAKLSGITIPTLCHLHGVHTHGSCRICVVEVEGAKNLLASCIVKAQEGMVVRTNTEKVRAARKVLYDLMLSNHPKECTACSRNLSCELQELGNTLGILETHFHGEAGPARLDISPSITRDTRKCILCRRCVTICTNVQGVGAISGQSRGFNTVISPPLGMPLESVHCAMCGQCTLVCPTGALTETDGMDMVWNALHDPNTRVAVQVAPAVRAALGEEFSLPAGTLVTGKLATALRDLGFDDVFDTNFAADLTIMEEGTELLHRLRDAVTGKGASLPMITSCSPGWIKHIEHAFPEELSHLSTCKSPHTMLGALIKSYYTDKIGLPPEKMFVVSVMPCTAKKFEIDRPEMQNRDNPNVDAVITTRELARMIRTMGIDFKNLPDSSFDAPLGFSTGAADIFGVTGGVMEAALRTVYELVTGRELAPNALKLSPAEGLEGVSHGIVKFADCLPDFSYLEGVEAKVAVASGLKSADSIMKQIAAGESPYHFVEIMGCPEGCINGGGQPRVKSTGETDISEVLKLRREALGREDEGKEKRKSHENPDIIALYSEYLGEPASKLSHELLHTSYTKRGLYNEYLPPVLDIAVMCAEKDAES
ncbi:MAG: 2Fe-2S iron-sulfur cluster binding domain-containing protein [Clostridiales bacterium]|nr:2Fe-2S iron-sulfur cluster binding domain-containing protein [Clostridiales bacterium]